MANLLTRIAGLFNQGTGTDGNAAANTVCGWQLPLADAVHEAITLLAFASRSGKALDAEQIKAILAMGRLIDCGSGIVGIDPDKEQAFWQAYCHVVAEIRPVSSESINATLESHASWRAGYWRKRPIAQQTVFNYGVCSLVVLLSIIFFQSYMQMGMSIRNHLQTSFYSQKQSVETFFAERIKTEDDKLKAAGGVSQENPVKTLYEKYKVELQLAKLRASQDELHSWGKEGDRVLVALGMATEDTLSSNPANTVSLDFYLNRQPAPGMADTSPIGPNHQPNQNLPGAEMDKANGLVLAELRTVVIPTYIALNESEQILRLISEFVLPLLYGLLGACAYVLRDLTNTIGSVTFSKSKMINYKLRLIMGPLVGIAVGLFLGSPDAGLISEPTDASTMGSSPPNVSQLSTLALAFLAGYSVEVLFSALDTLVSAFASNNHPKGKDTKDIGA